jgi:4-hydroxyphenylpyruvate dioxygenase
MKTSIATVSISGTLEEKLRAVAAAGFDAVEIFENDLLTFPGTPRDVGRMVRDLGMQVSLFQPFRDLEGLPEPLRIRAFDRMARKFDVMSELGTDLILLCSNCSTSAQPDRQAMVDDLSALGELAARHQMRVGYEALAWGRHVNDHRDAWSLVRDVDHPNIGLILDSFHSLSRQIPSASIGDIRGDKLFIVQIADAPKLDMDYLYWSRHFRNMPGQGDFPLAEFAAAVLRTGYQGYWSLEIFNDRFRAASTAGVALDGYRSLQLLDDSAGRRLRPPATPKMPSPVAVERVAFIEFAASDEEAVALGSMLGALGFQPTGHHKRKLVTRWTQGDINLIVNCDPDGLRAQLRQRARCVRLRHWTGRARCARGHATGRGARHTALHAGGGAGRNADSERARRGRQPALFHRGGHRRAGLGAGVRAAAGSEGRGNAGSRQRGSHRADHAL